MPYKLNASFGEICFLHLSQKRIVVKTATVTSNYIGGGNEGDRYACPALPCGQSGPARLEPVVMTAAFCLGLMMAGR